MSINDNKIKIKIPSEIIEFWEYDQDDYEKVPEVYIYAKNTKKKIVMIASKEPLEGFDWIE